MRLSTYFKKYKYEQEEVDIELDFGIVININRIEILEIRILNKKKVEYTITKNSFTTKVLEWSNDFNKYWENYRTWINFDKDLLLQLWFSEWQGPTAGTSLEVYLADKDLLFEYDDYFKYCHVDVSISEIEEIQIKAKTPRGIIVLVDDKLTNPKNVLEELYKLY